MIYNYGRLPNLVSTIENFEKQSTREILILVKV